MYDDVDELIYMLHKRVRDNEHFRKALQEAVAQDCPERLKNLILETINEAAANKSARRKSSSKIINAVRERAVIDECFRKALQEAVAQDCPERLKNLILEVIDEEFTRTDKEPSGYQVR